MWVVQSLLTCTRSGMEPPAGCATLVGVTHTRPTLDLLREAQAGEAAALEDLCARYLPRMTRWARGRLPAFARDAFDTTDLVQEALLRTVARLERMDIQSAGCFQAYARQVLLNRIREQLRRAKPHDPSTAVLEAQVDVAPSPLEESIGADVLARYEAALARLTPEEQELIVARLETQYTFQEIAENLGKPSADAARMAARRALVRLAKEMGDGATT